MTLSQIRSQIEALLRKYATEVEVYRLDKVTAEFCDEVADALINPKSGPVKDPFDWASVLFKRMAKRGHHARNLTALQNYLSRCLQERRVLPQAREVLRALLPKAAERGLIPRTIEDPVPICAMKRGLENVGKGGDSGQSGLGLSDLVEHWQNMDYWRQLAKGSLPGKGPPEGATA